MLHHGIFVALSALSALVAADQNFTIDIAQVNLTTRISWCQGEFNTCGMLCNQATNDNKCDENTLAYSCLCSSNNSEPGLDYYTQTMPYFICQEAYKECVDSHKDNKTGQTACANDIQSQCGTLDPTTADVSSGDSSTTSSAASSSTTATAATAATVTSSSTSKAMAPTNVAYIGNGVAVVAAGVFAALL